MRRSRLSTPAALTALAATVATALAIAPAEAQTSSSRRQISGQGLISNHSTFTIDRASSERCDTALLNCSTLPEFLRTANTGRFTLSFLGAGVANGYSYGIRYRVAAAHATMFTIVPGCSWYVSTFRTRAGTFEGRLVTLALDGVYTNGRPYTPTCSTRSFSVDPETGVWTGHLAWE